MPTMPKNSCVSKRRKGSRRRRRRKLEIVQHETPVGLLKHYPTFDKNYPKFLDQYHALIFPYKLIYQMLSYKGDCCTREFGIKMDKDTYRRPLCFETLEDFAAYLRFIGTPQLEIGAIYCIPPIVAADESKLAVSGKEFVIDIDVSDFMAKSCCVNRDMCKSCWRYVVVACKILHAALTEDFGFKHLLWIFSGGRGVHCWVCDNEVIRLSETRREAILNYLTMLNFYEKGEDVYKPNETFQLGWSKRLHPAIERAVDIIGKEFIPLCIEDQKALDDKNLDTFFDVMDIRYPAFTDGLKEQFKKGNSSLERWTLFCQYLEDNPHRIVVNLRPHLIKEVMLGYCYPRVDKSVTCVLAHFLKSPFSIHHYSGKIAVPIEFERIDEFDIDEVANVATVDDIMTDLLDMGVQSDGLECLIESDVLDGTSLEGPFKIFKQFVQDLVRHKQEQ